MLYIKLKKIGEENLPPPPTPTPLTPKKTLHLHCQTPRKSTFSKTNRSEFEEQITNMWAQIKPFWAYYLPKIKTSNTKHNHETPHVHYNSNGSHIFAVHYSLHGARH